jgi:hypothetical protein
VLVSITGIAAITGTPRLAESIRAIIEIATHNICFFILLSSFYYRLLFFSSRLNCQRTYFINITIKNICQGDKNVRAVIEDGMKKLPKEKQGRNKTFAM